VNRNHKRRKENTNVDALRLGPRRCRGPMNQVAKPVVAFQAQFRPPDRSLLAEKRNQVLETARNISAPEMEKAILKTSHLMALMWVTTFLIFCAIPPVFRWPLHRQNCWIFLHAVRDDT
jgi:hypothetical protein